MHYIPMAGGASGPFGELQRTHARHRQHGSNGLQCCKQHLALQLARALLGYAGPPNDCHTMDDGVLAHLDCDVEEAACYVRLRVAHRAERGCDDVQHLPAASLYLISRQAEGDRPMRLE